MRGEGFSNTARGSQIQSELSLLLLPSSSSQTGGVRKLLQGSWWLNVTQLCLEGLVAEGYAGRQLAEGFATALLDDLLGRDGVVRVSHKELHSHEALSTLVALLGHCEALVALEVFLFAHAPISPICRNPLFPYLTF